MSRFSGSDHSWVDQALCASSDPDALFVQGSEQREVRVRCLECPVRLECLAEALQSHMRFGVWGGLTERERRALLRRYASVEDWGEWLEVSDEPLAVELRSVRPMRVLSLTRVG
ncbi:WhiB family transcriptional regulator [Actinomycetaceae bacterium WB03_NA08]|uniref:Transcriptional regulator WhiB n=1 Tax=Scrofimicrobium canadense TaxID=2652290 RepID=A0A6N7VNM4_9ACTO|nr:WhiB family transcriptional regulator [Scrofimicrobium canadense]MSS83287.1 WhiB family transcriptional regulator [Scrofimicrobium canadense]